MPNRPTAQTNDTTKAPRQHRPLWLTVVINFVAAVVVLSLIQNFVVRIHAVSSGSMERTLMTSDRVFVSNLPYLSAEPRRGDIVAFAHGETWNEPIKKPSSNGLVNAGRLFGDLTGIGPSNRFYTVKRIIGVPGDVVSCCDERGRLLVNQQPLDEPYISNDYPFTPGVLDAATSPVSPRCFIPIVVPAGKYLVMGDNRSNSSDSVLACRSNNARDCARLLDQEQITGKVIAKIWPFQWLA